MIRAIFLSNLLYLAVSFIGGAVVGFVYGFVLVAQLGGVAGHTAEILSTFGNSPTFGYLVLAVIVFAEIWAGAAAAWMAKENMVVAGLFSNLLPFLGALLRSWAISYLGPSYHPTHRVTLPEVAPYLTGYAAPLLGLLGSIVAAVASFRVVFRWLAMLAVGFLIYGAIHGIGAQIGLRVLDVGAATLAVAAGVFIAPPEHRAQAFLTLLFLTIFVPLGALAWQLEGHEGSPMTNLLWTAFNAAGCACAFLWLKHRLQSDYGETQTG